MEESFRYLGLDWHEFVVSDPELLRPADIKIGSANPGKAKMVMGWQAKTLVDGVIAEMCNATQSRV